LQSYKIFFSYLLFMDIQQRIKAFVKLGSFLKQFDSVFEEGSGLSDLNEKYAAPFSELILIQKAHNGWFVESNVRKAINALADNLTNAKLTNWLSNYNCKKESLKRVGVIMAGNIPLVGFQDYLCVLISGNVLVAKLSKQDSMILAFVSKVLISIEPSFSSRIIFTEGKLENMHGFIATGSNNSARYFEYYFGKYPHIIRKNRNSIAVLDGNETDDELGLLGNDIFDYFGLGCRSVSKVFLPCGFPLDKLFGALYPFHNIIENNKYANNFDYNRVIYLMNQQSILENGFLLLKEDIGLGSPIAVLYYEYYNSIEAVKKRINEQRGEIQCVIASKSVIKDAVAFGDSQCPTLYDYSDGVDVMNFIVSLDKK